MMEKSQEELNAWKTEMHMYEKNKRTKKPFGKSVPKTEYVKYSDVKQKQTLFNPVLQVYKHQNDEERRNHSDQFNRAKSLMNHLKQVQKYDREFDIVNLHGGSEGNQGVFEVPNKKLGPIRNIYNVINNQKLPDFHFSKREFRLPVERQKNLIHYNEKQYNIVTGIYNDNHEERAVKEQQQQNEHIFGKYWKNRDYDPVFGKHYSENRQKDYQEKRKVDEKNHGKDYDKKFPPSYVFRQQFIPDPTKPLPETLRTLDEKTKNAKKRYQLKYVIEDDYGRRNFEDDKKHETVIKAKVHNNRVVEEKSKQFNILSNKNYNESRAEDLFGKKIIKSTWQKLVPSETSKIKTGGFN